MSQWYLSQVLREGKVSAVLTEYSKVVFPGHLSSKLFPFCHQCADCAERESSRTPRLRQWHKEVSCFSLSSCQLPIPTLGCEIISLSPLEAVKEFLSFSRKSMSPKNSEKFRQSCLLIVYSFILLLLSFCFIQPCHIGVWEVKRAKMPSLECRIGSNFFYFTVDTVVNQLTNTFH